MAFLRFDILMLTELHVLVSGMVQGVGYRDFVRSAAEEYEVKGWVKNRDDGIVEIVAQGYPDALKLFQSRLSEGSVLSKIDNIATAIRTPRVLYEDFSLRV